MSKIVVRSDDGMLSLAADAAWVDFQSEAEKFIRALENLRDMDVYDESINKLDHILAQIEEILDSEFVIDGAKIPVVVES